MKLYRYDINTYGHADDDWPAVRVELTTYEVLRETPQGYWIIPESMARENKQYYKRFKRWTSKAARNRRAYPTKEEAMANFRRRTKSRISILEYQMKVCREALLRSVGTEQLNQDK